MSVAASLENRWYTYRYKEEYTFIDLAIIKSFNLHYIKLKCANTNSISSTRPCQANEMLWSYVANK